MICQWCFEEEAIEGKTVCEACRKAIEDDKDDTPFEELLEGM